MHDRLYLLSPTHSVGKGKERFFTAGGFDLAHVKSLRDALLTVAHSADVREAVSSPHGIKYVLESEISTPSGAQVEVRTVWIIETGQENPRFVTAYPL